MDARDSWLREEVGNPEKLPVVRTLSTSIRAWIRLLRTSQKIQRVLTRGVKHWGINLSQFDVLAQVGANEGLTQGQLAESLLVTRGNVVQMLDKMERMGLLMRRPAGRANRIFLTDEGRRLSREVVPAQVALVDEQLCSLSQGEQETLLELLRKLDRSLG